MLHASAHPGRHTIAYCKAGYYGVSGWKWQDIVEGQSFNEPLRDQSWWPNNFSSTHPGRGNQRPSVFHSIPHPPTPPPSCPLLPALHKQTNYSNGYKLDPFPENAPSIFFSAFILSSISLPTMWAVCTHESTHIHTGVRACAWSVSSLHRLPDLWSSLDLAALCLLNLLSRGIQIENGLSFISLPPLFTLQPAPNLSLHHTLG